MSNTNVPELFGSLVFNQTVMKEMLPAQTFKALKHTMEHGTPLDLDAANQIAEAMKNWAISKGATHYSHWFQPLTGITAEKHDSFLTPSDEGKIIMSLLKANLTLQVFLTAENVLLSKPAAIQYGIQLRILL